MGVILILVGLITSVLLYEFFTTYKWQQVDSGPRLDAVFQNRNKAYGAYALRKAYSKVMIFSMIGMVAFTLVSYAGYSVVTGWKVAAPKKKPKTVVVDFVAPAEPEEETPPPPEETPPPPQEETVAFNPPIIVDIPVDDEIPPQDKLENTTASDKTQDGQDFPDGTQQETVPTDTPEEKPKEQEILDFVEEEATFPGGNIQRWINENVVYPDVSKELGEQGKVYVEFVVEPDGSITNVKVARSVSEDLDKEAVRVIRRMPRWNPGKNNGKAVRQRCRLPINFQLS